MTDTMKTRIKDGDTMVEDTMPNKYPESSTTPTPTQTPKPASTDPIVNKINN